MNIRETEAAEIEPWWVTFLGFLVLTLLLILALVAV